MERAAPAAAAPTFGMPGPAGFPRDDSYRVLSSCRCSNMQASAPIAVPVRAAVLRLVAGVTAASLLLKAAAPVAVTKSRHSDNNSNNKRIKDANISNSC